MAAFTSIIAAAGLGLAAGGLALNYTSSQKMAKSQEESIALQRRQDEERRKAMELDAARRKREMIRQALAARSRALSVATAQNAGAGTGLQGAYGGIQGRTGVNLLGVDQNLEIGRTMFGLQAGISEANASAARWGSMAQTGAGLTSLGGSLIKNMDAISRIGSTVASWFPSGTTPNWSGPSQPAGSLY